MGATASELVALEFHLWCLGTLNTEDGNWPYP